MDHLYRDLAPISDAAWQEIEKEARRTLKTTLAARKLVDFVGPQGWDASAVGIGRSSPVEPPSPGHVEARLREVLPMVELRVPFEMRRDELDAIDRGAKDPDTDAISEAARRIAIAEDRAIFHGYPAAGISGICERDGAKYCAGTPKENGKLLQCLLTLTRGPSVACTRAISEAGYR